MPFLPESWHLRALSNFEGVSLHFMVRSALGGQVQLRSDLHHGERRDIQRESIPIGEFYLQLMARTFRMPPYKL
jgi:hypothetical protein